MSNWEYNEVYKKYDMSGNIKIGTGIVKVHNIFDELPEFMLQADCLFCDPPCSLGNINTFYTKADREDYQISYASFVNRFFECIDEINPKIVFVEVFKTNKEIFAEELSKRYKYIHIYDSKYYNNPKNQCWVIQAQNEPITTFDIDNMDEEKIIQFICKNINYNCIADLCMGRGLVGYYSNMYNKKFVGTELNKKRLAVLLDRISKGKK